MARTITVPAADVVLATSGMLCAQLDMRDAVNALRGPTNDATLARLADMLDAAQLQLLADREGLVRSYAAARATEPPVPTAGEAHAARA